MVKKWQPDPRAAPSPSFLHRRSTQEGQPKDLPFRSFAEFTKDFFSEQMVSWDSAMCADYGSGWLIRIRFGTAEVESLIWRWPPVFSAFLPILMYGKMKVGRCRDILSGSCDFVVDSHLVLHWLGYLLSNKPPSGVFWREQLCAKRDFVTSFLRGKGVFFCS